MQAAVAASCLLALPQLTGVLEPEFLAGWSQRHLLVVWSQRSFTKTVLIGPLLLLLVVLHIRAFLGLWPKSENNNDEVFGNRGGFNMFMVYRQNGERSWSQ